MIIWGKYIMQILCTIFKGWSLKGNHEIIGFDALNTHEKKLDRLILNNLKSFKR